MKTSKQTAPHSMWQEVCDAWALLDRQDLSVKHEKMPAGSAETAHHHVQARQFFFVLSGELTLRVEAVDQVISAREGLEVKPGTIHQARNDSGADVEFLVISSPTTNEDRIEI